MNSNYYDHPEGEDAFGKMVATNKYAAGAGLFMSTVDVLMVSRTQGYLPTIGRFVTITSPLLAMATAFTMGTYISTNIRKKDDRLNYIIGGYCAGAALGAVKKNPVTALTTGTFLAIAASIKKLSKIEGWEFFPDIKYHEYMPLRGHDFTLTAEREKNWTTGKDE